MDHQKSNHFICRHCGEKVELNAPGTKNRNHCPYCLYSRHVDIVRGDRKSKCGGMMKPVGTVKRKDGELLIVHQCQSCGYICKNRIAGDDNEEILDSLTKSGVGELLV